MVGLGDRPVAPLYPFSHPGEHGKAQEQDREFGRDGTPNVYQDDQCRDAPEQGIE